MRMSRMLMTIGFIIAGIGGLRYFNTTPIDYSPSWDIPPYETLPQKVFHLILRAFWNIINSIIVGVENFHAEQNRLSGGHWLATGGVVIAAGLIVFLIERKRAGSQEAVPLKGSFTLKSSGVRKKRCVKCGTESSESAAAFCRACGTAFEKISSESERYCHQCKTPVSETAKFCVSCGAALSPMSLKGS